VLRPTPKGGTAAWSVAKSAALYGIGRWGGGSFGISTDGSVVVKTRVGDDESSVELIEIIEGLRQRGSDMPVLLRVENLIDERISALNETFRRIIQETGYQGQFRGVFPIKVNQQQHVIEELTRFGQPFEHGLEAGSKAELLIAISTLPSTQSFIICNGYKDAEFVDLGLQATRLGFKCFFVIETPGEVSLILDRAKFWNIEPLIGVRLKLNTKVDGHWSNDSGERSLFGLSTRQLIEVVDTLRSADMLHCFQLLHFHLGSQIPNVRNIRDGIKEACRFYIDLVEEGAPLSYLDLGGGLAVDYDGSSSTASHSRNYSLEEYCADVVEGVIESLAPHGVKHPTLITESGRWTVAPMSVLLFNVLSVSHFDPTPVEDIERKELSDPVNALLDILGSISRKRLQEHYNDLVYYRDGMRDLFRQGQVDLRELAYGENICYNILHKIAKLVRTLKRPPVELENVCDSLSDIYYGNFSVFQSLPDAWAIEQVFPVMPLHRLNEEPTRRGIIADLTCDCDGKLDRFVTEEFESTTLPLHEFHEGQEYYIGVFLVGAYQETLGDFHNLFGDTNVASIRIDANNHVEFVQEISGDSIADVLGYVEYQPQEMYSRFRKFAEQSVRDGNITVEQRQQMLTLFSESLRGYTYFESN
jgi:arginine decarboxylase